MGRWNVNSRERVRPMYPPKISSACGKPCRNTEYIDMSGRDWISIYIPDV
jgi:hypothetical protein